MLYSSEKKGKTEAFHSVLKTFPHVSNDSHHGKRGSTFRKTTFLLLIHFLTTSSAVLVFRQKNVKWHYDDKIEHFDFDIYWRYILKIYWWLSEHFNQTSVTSGPDYGCACLIDLTELYLNSKKSFGVTRKTFSWQNQKNQHHKYDWIEKVWAKITLSSKWKENKTNSTRLIMRTISSYSMYITR